MSSQVLNVSVFPGLKTFLKWKYLRISPFILKCALYPSKALTSQLMQRKKVNFENFSDGVVRNAAGST